MARRKQEVQLQRELETQEEWEEMLSKEGLLVVDVYQEWSGPCTAMLSNFRRLKNELSDDLLRFAAAKSDRIDALEKYRGKCEPCYLFFASGFLVAVIRGANSPLLLKMIVQQLKQEHKVLKGESERKEITDPVIAKMEEMERLQREAEELEKLKVPKQVTVAIIKPDAVKAGKVEEILKQMTSSGLEILTQEERQLTEGEAKEFYAHLSEEEYFEELVQFMSQGPSYILVVSKAGTANNIVNEWRNMIGPTMVETAKEEAPASLRAQFGTGNYMNAVHGSENSDIAANELAFFFPDFVVPKVMREVKPLERTLALIRPDAFRLYADEIMEKIEEAGFQVALSKEMQLTKEQAEEFYKEHKDQEYFEELTTEMSSGPLLALGLAREDAIQGWRELLGPTVVEKAKEEAPESFRAMYSMDEVGINLLHGSDSPTDAENELNFFFPVEETLAVIKPDGYATKDEIIEKIHNAGFRIAAQKETILSKDIAESFYEEHRDKEYFDDLVHHMTSGPTMFMVLSREDAIQGWRNTIGPTDPEIAKLEVPETLRAMYGEDVLKNAVHGSSSMEHAKKTILSLFNDDAALLSELHFRAEKEDEGAQDEQVALGVEGIETEGEETAAEQREEQGEEGGTETEGEGTAAEQREEQREEEGGTETEGGETAAEQREKQREEEGDDQKEPEAALEKKESDISQEKEEPDVPQEKEESHVPQEKEEPDVPQEKEESHVPQEKEESHVPQEKEEPDVPQEKEEPDVPQEKEEPDVPQEKEESHVPQEKEEPDVPQEKEESHVPQEKKESDVPQEKEESDIQKEESDVPQEKVLDNP